jgi:hypothetical protein
MHNESENDAKSSADGEVTGEEADDEREATDEDNSQVNEGGELAVPSEHDSSSQAFHSRESLIEIVQHDCDPAASSESAGSSCAFANQTTTVDRYLRPPNMEPYYRGISPIQSPPLGYQPRSTSMPSRQSHAHRRYEQETADATKFATDYFSGQRSFSQARDSVATAPPGLTVTRAGLDLPDMLNVPTGPRPMGGTVANPYTRSCSAAPRSSRGRRRPGHQQPRDFGTGAQSGPSSRYGQAYADQAQCGLSAEALSYLRPSWSPTRDGSTPEQQTRRSYTRPSLSPIRMRSPLELTKEQISLGWQRDAETGEITIPRSSSRS